MTSAERSLTKTQVWILAARPKTLPASATPVIIAGALATGDGAFHLLAFLAALFDALLLQIAANLANDLFDFEKSVDTHERLGPLRVTQAGLVSRRQMRVATGSVLTLALVIGIYLVARGGLPILIIGIASIVFSVLYTAGPYPLAYVGLGELFVLVFFGLVPVGGAYYVMAQRISAPIILAGIGPGLLSIAILTVNNLRDIDTDRTTGKRTLAVRFGKRFAQYEYLAVVCLALLYPPIHILAFHSRPWLLLACGALLPAIPLMKAVLTLEGRALNNTLAGTGRLLLVYGLLFSLGRLL